MGMYNAVVDNEYKNKSYNLFNITIEPNINIDKTMVGYLVLQHFLKETFVFQFMTITNYFTYHTIFYLIF